jgi:DNA-binding MarR family transcriptional regulator
MSVGTRLSIPERLLDLVSRLLKLGLDHNPLQGSGITTPQLTLLDFVAGCPGCSLRDIAHGLDLTPPTVSVGVRRLEEAGLLERCVDPADKRSIRISATARGQVLHQRALAFRLERMERLLAGLNKDETTILLDLMDKAIDAAQRHTD